MSVPLATNKQNALYNNINKIPIFTVNNPNFSTLDGMGFTIGLPVVGDSLMNLLGLPKVTTPCILISEKFLYGFLDGNDEFYKFIIESSSLKIELMTNPRNIIHDRTLEETVFLRLLKVYSNDELKNLITIHRDYTLDRYNQILVKMHKVNAPDIEILKNSIFNINAAFDKQFSTLDSLDSSNRN